MTGNVLSSSDVTLADGHAGEALPKAAKGPAITSSCWVASKDNDLVLKIARDQKHILLAILRYLAFPINVNVIN